MSCFSECVKLKEHLLANCIKIYSPNLIERLFLSVPLIGCLLEDVTLYSLLVFYGKKTISSFTAIPCGIVRWKNNT